MLSLDLIAFAAESTAEKKEKKTDVENLVEIVIEKGKNWLSDPN